MHNVKWMLCEKCTLQCSLVFEGHTDFSLCRLYSGMIDFISNHDYNCWFNAVICVLCLKVDNTETRARAFLVKLCQACTAAIFPSCSVQGLQQVQHLFSWTKIRCQSRTFPAALSKNWRTIPTPFTHYGCDHLETPFSFRGISHHLNLMSSTSPFATKDPILPIFGGGAENL